MTPDDYFRTVLSRYNVPCGSLSKTERVANQVMVIMKKRMQPWLLRAELSGSYAKGTAVRGSSDCDIFLSFSSVMPINLKQLYNEVSRHVRSIGLKPRPQNVSIGITFDGIKIDLVPAKRQNQYDDDHSLYNRRRDSWIQTNIQKQINYVSNSGRTEEIQAMKIWRNLNVLEFPSYYLELVVIETLRNRQRNDLTRNIYHVLEFLANQFIGAAFYDVANSNNAVSDDLTDNEKIFVEKQAQISLQKRLDQFIW